jgi:DNA-binding CsgD family transcriptional regulator
VRQSSRKTQDKAQRERQRTSRGAIHPPAVQTKQLSSIVLRSATVGVAVFDEAFRCTEINSVLSTMTGLAAKACAGKTLQEMFGGEAFILEGAMRFVRDTRKAIRNVSVDVQVAREVPMKHWVADCFPICDPAKQIRWIGSAFCEAQQNQKSLSSSLLRKASRGENRDLDTVGYCGIEVAQTVDAYDPKLRETLNQINRSVLLRRQLAQRRVTSNVLHQIDTRANRTAFCRALSLREMEVVRLLAEGKSNKEIAIDLQLSIRTVETYRARLMSKLELHSIADLIRYAIRNQLIDL